MLVETVFIKLLFQYSQAHLYLGLMLMCGFVLFDTQLIIEKRRMGSKDFVQHALELFIDFIGMFRRLVIILTQKVTKDGKKSTANIFALFYVVMFASDPLYCSIVTKYRPTLPF